MSLANRKHLKIVLGSSSLFQSLTLEVHQA
jgi:hypothetical protein